MSCNDVRQNIVLLLYGEASAAESTAIERHVGQCPDCRFALAEERRLHGMLAQRRSADPDDQLLALCRDDLSRALRAGERSAVVADDRAVPLPGRIAAWLNPVSSVIRMRPSPAFAGAFLLVGFLSGWLAFGRGTTPAVTHQVPEGAAASARASVGNLKSLRFDPSRDRVSLNYDMLQRSSFEGRVDDPEIRRMLIDTLNNSSNAGLRLDAIDLLGAQVADFEVRQALMRALRNDQNPGARLKALAALDVRASSDSEVRSVVTDALLRDDNLGIRIRAIDSLARAGDPTLAPVMRRLARDDSNSYIRRRSGAIADAMYARAKR